MKVKIKFKDLFDLYFKPGEEIIIEAEPIEEWPKKGQFYWAPNIVLPESAFESESIEDLIDSYRKAHNLIFRTKEEAIARSKEILEMIKK